MRPSIPGFFRLLLLTGLLATVSGCSSPEADPGPSCVVATDCPTTGDECLQPACVAGRCATAAVADDTNTVEGQVTGDCQKRVCNGGAAQFVFDDTDPADDHLACTADTCEHGAPVHTAVAGPCDENGGEVCGAPSGVHAGRCVACNLDQDCPTPKVCDPAQKTGTCVDPTCSDGARNGDETDIDCGGTCAPCPDTSKCAVAEDCQSGHCNSALTCAPCTTHEDCAPAQFCDEAGLCRPDQASGACTVSAQCLTGHCADGFCCDAACEGLCLACSAAKKGAGDDGVCGPVGSGSDPDDDCAASLADSCGDTGDCNGAGACAIYSAETSCRAESCVSGIHSPAQFCDGSGVCASAGQSNCGAYACDAAGRACRTACTSGEDCATGFFCNGSTCEAKRSNGMDCTDGAACRTGFCVDRVCCDRACSETCVRCNIEFTRGTCYSIPPGTDPDAECTGASACDGAGHCG